MSPALAGPGAGFRVRPYLQNPSSHSMLVTWFSWTRTPGALHLPGRQAIVTAPHLQPVLDWTEANRAQAIEHPEWGQWFREGRNYRHQVHLEGLEPNTSYPYTVRQGDAEARGTLTTAPTREHWRHIRLTAVADSETGPAGRVQRRLWAPGVLAPGSIRPAVQDSAWARTFGTSTHRGEQVLNYPLTAAEGFAHNIAHIAARTPDLMLFAGDLVRGGGYQPAWDEWFRHLAGEVTAPASDHPVVTALGNWEPFGASDGGYSIPAVIKGRASYRCYFTPPPNGTPAHQGNYHRLDYGPLTILTLDSTKGTPDDHPGNYSEADRLHGRAYTGAGTDTQCNYTSSDYLAGGGHDLSPFNPGGRQWDWVREQLAAARAQGQVIVVQFHHPPFSSGQHGLPMNHAQSTGQGGTPMRVYHRLFMEYGVVAVLSGHSELFERSYVEVDGRGIHYYDVGVGGDSHDGERRLAGSASPLLGYNPYSAWTADRCEPEVWDGEHLTAGGKHYGHLEINLHRSEEPGTAATMTLTPVHSFPQLDDGLRVRGTERRSYDDEVVLSIATDGTVQ